MCELFNNRKTVVWFLELAFVGSALLAGIPARPALPPAPPPILLTHGQTHTRTLGLCPVAFAGIVERASEASGGTRRTASSEPQTGGASKLRDPFKAPEPPPKVSALKAKRSHLPAVLPPGVRGLVIDQLILEGVVDKKPDNAMIAVVTNKSNRAYFLRINEQVFDGTVTMITPAAIYFRQRYYSDDDKAEWRTVEKRLSPGPGGKK